VLDQSYMHERTGLVLFGGGGAQYSLPEQANLTLIYTLICRGGGVTKKCFPDIPKTCQQTYENFAGHIKNFPNIF
jgi:hypothetical protein